MKKIAILLYAVLFLSTPSHAHHVADGRAPENFMEGMFSGLLHPMIEFDHFVFICAVALLAMASQKFLLMIASFVGATMAGLMMRFLVPELPGIEMLIGVLAITGGCLLIFASMRKLVGVSALVLTGGLIHGYAFAESVVGASGIAQVGYSLGLLAMETVIAIGLIALIRPIAKAHTVWYKNAQGAGGIALSLFGLFSLLPDMGQFFIAAT